MKCFKEAEKVSTEKQPQHTLLESNFTVIKSLCILRWGNGGELARSKQTQRREVVEELQRQGVHSETEERCGHFFPNSDCNK